MKNLKSKSKNKTKRRADDKSNPKLYSALRTEDERVVERQYPRLNKFEAVKISKQLPQPEHIAMIAATLGQNTDAGNTDSLVDTAMKLWIASRDRIILEDGRVNLGIQIDEFDSYYYKKFHPSLFNPPITRDQFLTTMLPQLKSRNAALRRIGKAFLSSKLREEIEKEPTPMEVDVAYGKWSGYETIDAANSEAARFIMWHPVHISEMRRVAGKKAAQMRLVAAEAENPQAKNNKKKS